MPVIHLSGKHNLADEIVDALFAGKSQGEMTKLAKSFLDHTINHPAVTEMQKAKMIASICWENGLNPPDKIKRLLL